MVEGANFFAPRTIELANFIFRIVLAILHISKKIERITLKIDSIGTYIRMQKAHFMTVGL